MVQYNYMVLKVFKVIWIISLLAVCAVFFYAYSTLQEQVVLGMDIPTISKTLFFYSFISIIAVFNGIAFGALKIFGDYWKRAWFYGLLTTLHLFLSATFIFLAIINSNERYDYGNLGPTVVGSFVIFILWILAFPVIPLLTRSFSEKRI